MRCSAMPNSCRMGIYGDIPERAKQVLTRDPDERRASPQPHQRRARYFQDRSGRTFAFARRLFDARRDRDRRQRHRLAGANKGASHLHRYRAGPARRPRRRAPADAGALEHRQQCHQIHRSRRRDDPRQGRRNGISSLPSRIPGRASRPRIRHASSKPSIRSTVRSPSKKAVPASGFRSASASSKCTGARSALLRSSARDRHFKSRFRCASSGRWRRHDKAHSCRRRYRGQSPDFA